MIERGSSLWCIKYKMSISQTTVKDNLFHELYMYIEFLQRMHYLHIYTRVFTILIEAISNQVSAIHCLVNIDLWKIKQNAYPHLMILNTNNNDFYVTAIKDGYIIIKELLMNLYANILDHTSIVLLDHRGKN